MSTKKKRKANGVAKKENLKWFSKLEWQAMPNEYKPIVSLWSEMSTFQGCMEICKSAARKLPLQGLFTATEQVTSFKRGTA